MADEVIRYGAGGVPYKGAVGTTAPAPAPEPEVELELEEEEAPVVSVEVTEKEALGDIPKGKKK